LRLSIAGQRRGMSTVTATRRLGGVDVFPIGLGAMPLSLEGRPGEADAIRTIHAALDAGVDLVDTADAYAPDESEVGHNERLVARALHGRRDDVIVATKGGHVRRGRAWDVDGRPEHLRAACEASLRALGTDRIDLYQFHRPDPAVPFAESVGAFKELQDEGKVRWVGLSNVTVAELEEALDIVDVVAVQNQLSVEFTHPIAAGEVAACAERGIAFLPWSPLGGIGKAGSVTAIAAVKDVAAAHGVSPQQAVLAWLLRLGPTVVPIPGARRPETIRDSAAAAALELADDEVAAISRSAGA
jgi:aryl-alcohol dehydrogenase-like predicted oxidoreductase